jgi:hypothetical protein
MDLRKTEWGHMDWNNLAQDMRQVVGMFIMFWNSHHVTVSSHPDDSLLSFTTTSLYTKALPFCVLLPAPNQLLISPYTLFHACFFYIQCCFQAHDQTQLFSYPGVLILETSCMFLVVSGWRDGLGSS